MRRRSIFLTATTAVAVLTAVVFAGSSPLVTKAKRRAKAKAAALASATSSASAAVAAAATASASTVASVAPPKPIKLTIGPGTKVLVFGDSMVDAGFSQRLDKLVKERGGTLVHDAWTSASTTSWSKGDRLANLLAVHHPDVVIVALGANEVFLPAPEAVAPRVRSIVAKVAPRPCVWVSPPLWKGETGIVAVERANATPCGFFDSGDLKVERQKDGIHPTPKGGGDWADAVWAGIVEPVASAPAAAPQVQ